MFTWLATQNGLFTNGEWMLALLGNTCAILYLLWLRQESRKTVRPFYYQEP